MQHCGYKIGSNLVASNLKTRRQLKNNSNNRRHKPSCLVDQPLMQSDSLKATTVDLYHTLIRNLIDQFANDRAKFEAEIGELKRRLEEKTWESEVMVSKYNCAIERIQILQRQLDYFRAHARQLEAEVSIIYDFSIQWAFS